MPIVITPRARRDLASIRDYLLARSPAGAERVRLAIRTTTRLLANHPRLGRERPDLGVRAVGVARFSYTIYYRLRDDRIEIIHIRDDRREPLVQGDV